MSSDIPTGSGVAQSHQVVVTSTNGGYLQQNKLVNGRTYRITAWLKGASGGESVRLSDNVGTSPSFPITNGWLRYSRTFTAADTTLRVSGAISPQTFLIAGVHAEELTGQSNTNPSEYVSTGVLAAPYHGAGVDGVKYFSTKNGNTVASNVVTEATGAAINSNASSASAITTDATGPFGYLAEGSRTNVFQRSEEIDNAYWSMTNATITANATTAPNGTSTADALVDTGANTFHRIQRSDTIATTETLSIYVTAGTQTNNYLEYYNGTISEFTFFNLSGSGSVSSTYAGSNAQISALPNGWYRISAVPTLSSVTIWTIGAGSGQNYAGTGGITLYFWGAQRETGAFASSYIPTTTVAVTRNVDVLLYQTASNLSDTAGTASAEAVASSWSNAGGQYLGDGTESPLKVSTTNTGIQVFDGINTGSGPTGTPSGVVKIASKWSGSSMTAYGNSTAGTAATYDGAFALAQLNIGQGSWYGSIRNVKIYDTALSDSAIAGIPSNLSGGSAISDSSSITANRADFEADLTSTLELQRGVGAPTFSRADGADRRASVLDFEGIVRKVKAGEARFEGARRVENLATFSENFSNAVWSVYCSSATPASGISDPEGGTGAWSLTTGNGCGANYGGIVRTGAVSGVTYTVSAWMRAATGTLVVDLGLDDAQYATFTLDTTWRRYSYTGTTGVNNRLFELRENVASPPAIYIYHPQIEEVGGQATQAPSEYVSTNVKATPFHGANVDGVKYFDTVNGNTVASNVVTEATGSTIAEATRKGYLAEGARSNIALQSESLNIGSWNSYQGSLVANALASPDGGTTMEKWTNNTVNNYHVLSQVNITLVAATYTFSAYVKMNGANSYNQLHIDFIKDSSYTKSAHVTYDLLAGTVGTPSVTGYTSPSATITSAGNGIYRITLTMTVDATTTAQAKLYQSLSGTPIFAGDGSSGFYIWGVQLEQGPFASSYIPTTSATVTRAVDNLTYPSTGNFTILNPYTLSGEATLKGLNVAAGSYQTLFSTNLNYAAILLAWYNPNDARFYSSSSALAPATNNVSDSVKTSLTRYAGRMDGTNVNLFVNGAVGNTQAKGTQTAEVNTLYVGTDKTVNALFGNAKNVKIWQKALDTTTLNALTAGTAGTIKKTTINVNQNDKQTSGLVGLWTFNGKDLSGVTAYDRSIGGSNHGTLTNGPAVTEGKVGQALSFDGVNDYIIVADSTSLKPSGDFALSVWVRPTSTSVQQGILQKMETSTNVGYRMTFRNTGVIWCDTGTINTSTGSNTVTYSASEWQHIVCVRSGSSMLVYKNGTLAATASTISGSITATNALEIGLNGNGESFGRNIDEVRIYNTAISASDVANLYNLGR